MQGSVIINFRVEGYPAPHMFPTCHLYSACLPDPAHLPHLPFLSGYPALAPLWGKIGSPCSWSWYLLCRLLCRSTQDKREREREREKERGKERKREGEREMRHCDTALRERERKRQFWVEMPVSAEHISCPAIKIHLDISWHLHHLPRLPRPTHLPHWHITQTRIPRRGPDVGHGNSMD